MDAIRQWRENMRFNPLSGQRFHRSINIEVSPLESENPNEVKVEVLLYEAADDEDEEVKSEDFEDADSTDETAPYEFADFPFTVTLVHQRTARILMKPLIVFANPNQTNGRLGLKKSNLRGVFGRQKKSPSITPKRTKMRKTQQ